MSTAPLSPRTAKRIKEKRLEAIRRKSRTQDGSSPPNVMAPGEAGDGSPPSGDGERSSLLAENDTTIGGHTCHNQSQDEPAPQPEMEASNAPPQDVICSSCVSKEPESSDVALPELGKVGDDHSVVCEVVNETGTSAREVAEDEGDHSASNGVPRVGDVCE